MKVYVVTSGSYSDYGIDAMFSTFHAAEVYSIIHHGNGVDEWEVDGEEIEDDGSHEIKDVYHCTIRLLDGEILYQYKGARKWAKKTARVRDEPKVGVSRYQYQDVPVITLNSYVSQEHANKLAVEARQEWLRSQL